LGASEFGAQRVYDLRVDDFGVRETVRMIRNAKICVGTSVWPKFDGDMTNALVVATPQFTARKFDYSYLQHILDYTLGMRSDALFIRVPKRSLDRGSIFSKAAKKYGYAWYVLQFNPVIFGGIRWRHVCFIVFVRYMEQYDPSRLKVLTPINKKTFWDISDTDPTPQCIEQTGPVVLIDENDCIMNMRHDRTYIYNGRQLTLTETNGLLCYPPWWDWPSRRGILKVALHSDEPPIISWLLHTVEQNRWASTRYNNRGGVVRDEVVILEDNEDRNLTALPPKWGWDKVPYVRIPDNWCTYDPYEK
jgi:hypothetical protein